MMLGLYLIISSKNMVRKILGLGIFQSSIILLYIAIGKILGGAPPLLGDHNVASQLFSNPLPHVLMLTAIVVGVANLALGLTLVVKTYKAYSEIDLQKIPEDAEMQVPV